jgi:ribonuclease HI
LVVRQVTGDWQTNEPELRPLRDHVQKLDDEFNQFGIQHISREENWEADELVEQVFSD